MSSPTEKINEIIKSYKRRKFERRVQGDDTKEEDNIIKGLVLALETIRKDINHGKIN